MEVTEPRFSLSDFIEKLRAFDGSNIIFNFSRERNLFQVGFHEKGETVTQNDLSLSAEEGNGLIASIFSGKPVPATSTSVYVTCDDGTVLNVSFRLTGERVYFNLFLVRIVYDSKGK